MLDPNDAVGQWWTGGDDVDTADDVAERVRDFWNTMRCDEADAVIVIGHSLFFQHLMRLGIDAHTLAKTKPALCAALRERKLCNAGCVGLDVVFDEKGCASVVDAGIIFGSRFEAKKKQNGGFQKGIGVGIDAMKGIMGGFMSGGGKHAHATTTTTTTAAAAAATTDEEEEDDEEESS